MKLGSPPLARGILSNIGAYAVGTGITPACAGNTSSFVSTARMLGDHPRLRGEYSDKILGSSPSVGSPPLARGIPNPEVLEAMERRITPACAGNTVA